MNSFIASWSSRLGALALLLTTATAFAAVSLSPDITYFYSDGPGEGLSVSPNGKFIMVSSPIPGANGTFTSSVPHLVHTPNANHPFVLTREVPLIPFGFGEVTDVGVLSHGAFGLAVTRADTDSATNALLAIRGNHLLQVLPIPQAPDGMKITPDGRYAIVAVERGGEIRIYDLAGGAGQIELAALVTKSALAAYFVGVPNPVALLEPEAVGIASDSSFALVTIQDCASLAGLDLTEVVTGQLLGLPPEQIGDLALKKVIHLPFGFVGNNGALFGVEPDGVAISPDASFAVVMHEANQRAKHLQGFSVIDLRNGIANMTSRTYNIFDLDPTLLQNTGLAACPVVAPGDPYPAAANRLPRLDPASVEIVNRGGQTTGVVVIERYDPSPAQLAASANNETRGSVIIMDVAQALTGSFGALVRQPVGVAGARLEVLETANSGRWLFVSISNGGGTNGTFARLELLAD